MHSLRTRLDSLCPTFLSLSFACTLAAGCGLDDPPSLPAEPVASARAALTLVTVTSSEEISGTPTANSYFGTRLALDGDTLAASQGSAAVVVLSKKTGTFRPQARLTGATSSGYYGGGLYNFALHGDLLVGGDPNVAARGASALGGVFVFARKDGVYTQQQFIPGWAPNQSLGRAVAVSGDTVAAADYSNPFSSGGVGGSVNVYVRSGGSYTLQQRLPRPSYIWQGKLAIEGNRIAVGDSSTVAIYDRSGGRFTLSAELGMPSGFSSFGHVVALSGDTVAANAFSGTVGRVFVFERGGSTWTKTAEIGISTPGVEYFGEQLALHGDTLLVAAAPRLGTGGAPPVYLYQRRGGAWQETGKLVLSGGVPASFGKSLAISGLRALVGTPYAEVLFQPRAGLVNEFTLPDPTLP